MSRRRRRAYTAGVPRAATPVAAGVGEGGGVAQAEAAYSEQNPMPVAVVSDYI